MTYHCALTLIGIIDHDGVREIIRQCQAARFGLALHPEQHMLKGNNTVHTKQSNHLLNASLFSAIRKLGLTAEWSCQLDSAAPSHHNPVMIYHAPSKTTVHGWTDELDIENKIQTNDTSKPATRVLATWPHPHDVLDKRGAAAFHIVKSRHEVMTLAGKPNGPLKEAAEAYLEARAERTQSDKVTQ